VVRPDRPRSPLEEAVERQASTQAIERVKARYCRFVDTKRWNDWRALFVDELFADLGGATFNSADALLRFAQSGLEGSVSVHVVTMPEINLLDMTRARGTWAMTDYVERKGSDPPVGFRGYGHYDEDYIKVDGLWRISRLRITRLRIDPLAGGLPPY
jgi:hypothetical protein